MKQKIFLLAACVLVSACHTLTPAEHTQNLKLETDGLRALCKVYQVDLKLPRDEVVTARCKALLESP